MSSWTRCGLLLCLTSCATARAEAGDPGGPEPAVRVSSPRVEPVNPAPRPPPLELEELSPEGARKLVHQGERPLTLINLWATWCEPCLHEMPAILRVAERYRKSGLALVLISADFSSERPRVQAQLEAWKISGPSYVKTGDDDAFVNAISRDWSGALPATLLVDAQGTTRYFHEGEIEEQALDQVLRLLLD